MSFTARLADISLTVLDDPAPELYSGHGDSERRARFTVLYEGSSKDDVNGFVARLNKRLASACDLVLASSNASYPVALHLLPGGAAVPETDALYELRNTALVAIDAPCEPWATPANRVFLPNPIGSEWPQSADIVRGSSSPYVDHFVFAENGRYCLIADGTARKSSLSFYGDLRGDEAVVIEFDYEIYSATSGNGLQITFAACAQKGGASVESISLLNATTVGRGHYRAVKRVPGSTPYFTLSASSKDVAGTLRAYIWDVEVGVKRLASPILLPRYVPDTCIGSLPWGWSPPSPSVGGVSWTTTADSAGNYMRCNASSSAGAAFAQSVTDRQTYAGALPVTPGRRLGVRFEAGCLSYSAGTFEVALVFRESDGTLVSRTSLAARTSVGSAITTYDSQVPEKAAVAYLEFGATAAGATFAGVLRNVDCGEYLLEAPGLVSLQSMRGEVAAPLEVWGNVGVESPAHLVSYAVGRADTAPYIVEAESLSWSGGAPTWSGTCYPPSGNNHWYTGWSYGTSRKTATIDTQALEPGTYELWARAAVGDVAAGGVLDCDESGVSVSVTTTALTWYSLGQIRCPSRRGWAGAATTITVGMSVSNATYVIGVDRYLFLPLTSGGAVTYHPAGSSTTCSSFDLLADGVPLVDSVADYASTIPHTPLMATSDDLLIVNAEKASVDEATHLVSVMPLHVPRYSLWRGG